MRKLKNLDLLSAETYKQLCSTGSGPGILYGLPKIHKPNFSTSFQFRPIFAAYNTAPYNLAKYFVPILSHLTVNEYSVKNSYSFVNDIEKITNADTLFMCSFDIENLYTNVPLQETINICTELMFSFNVSTVLGLSREYFKRLLELSVTNSIFLFNNALYKQIDGLGMGLSLSPTFANIFLCYYESIWLQDCPSDFKPVLYRRYVDDTFLQFRDPAHANLFLNYLNSKHQNISFTCEIENNNSLPFLDVNICRNSNKFDTKVFRKSTFTGLGTSFFSHCYFNFKLNFIKTLVYKAYHICSSYANFHCEIEFLKTFFLNNGFPTNLFYSVVNKFLFKYYEPSNNDSSDDPDDARKIYFRLQYFGHQSEKMKLEMQNVLMNLVPSVKFVFILSNTRTIGSLFKFKDTLPKESRSCVIYKYVCSQCEALYVGSTICTLHTRMSEHLGMSPRTGQSLSQPSQSSIRNHCYQSCQCAPSFSNFSVIDSDSNPLSLRIKESIHIHSSKPSLNETNSAYPLNILT